jgi:hypothetical protein
MKPHLGLVALYSDDNVSSYTYSSAAKHSIVYKANKQGPNVRVHYSASFASDRSTVSLKMVNEIYLSNCKEIYTYETTKLECSRSYTLR